jgi:hypothetical protein
MKDSALALVLIAALVGLAYLIGRTLTGRFTAWRGILERVVFTIPLGMAVIGYAVLALGLLRGLHTTVFVLVLVAGVPGLALLARDSAVGRRETAATSARIPAVAVVILALLGFCTLVAAIAPPVGLEWDALSYHLANQKTWLRAGRIFYLPWDHHSNFPFTVQMLYLLMLGVGSVSAAKLVHWLCGVLLVISVYTFATRHVHPAAKGRRVGWIAALLVASTPIVLWEATVAYIDLATALYTWLAIYALICAASAVSTNTRGNTAPSLHWIILSAVLMGFALGTKYTVLGFWGMGLVGILGWHYATTRRWAKETLPHAVLWGAVALVVALPWYLKTYLFTGDPVYPFGFRIFGGRYWSAANAAQYAAAQSKFGMGKSPLDLFLSPWLVTMEASHLTPQKPFIFTEYIVYGFGLSPVFVAMLLALPLIGKRLSIPGRCCLLFGLGVFVFWFFVMQQTRYLIPALPAFAVVVAESLVLLWEDRTSFSRWIAAALAAVSATWGVFIAGGMAFWGVPGVFGGALSPAWPVVAGEMSRGEYVSRRLGGLGRACAWINANTDPKAKVALFDEVRGFYLDRDYVWAQPDHAAGLLPWDTYRDVDDWLADFKRRGYTVLLENVSQATNDGARWRSLFTEAVAADKVTPAFEDHGVRVYLIP